MNNTQRFGEEEKKALCNLIDRSDKTLSNYSYSYYAEGGEVWKFEKEFARWLGRKYCVVVNSGTSALFVAIKACQYNYRECKGQFSVAIPAYTFVADAEAVLANQLEPLFLDINLDTYCMDITLNKIESLFEEEMPTITIPVHTLGNMVNPRLMREFKEEEGRFVIEDCAQCVGGKWKGKKAGTFGDISIFSGQGTKNLGCGEGGWICTDSEELMERCRAVSNHGDYYKYKFPNKKYPYLQNILGLNLRMTEMQAAIARCQLKKLPTYLKMFKRNAEIIFDLLPDGIDPPYIPKEVEHAYFILGCKWKGDIVKKNLFLDKLYKVHKKSGLLFSKQAPDIPGSNQPPGYSIGGGYSQPLYDLPLYRRYKRVCYNTEEVISRALWIDIHRFTSEEKVKTEMELFQKVYRQTIS